MLFADLSYEPNLSYNFRWVNDNLTFYHAICMNDFKTKCTSITDNYFYQGSDSITACFELLTRFTMKLAIWEEKAQDDTSTFLPSLRTGTYKNRTVPRIRCPPHDSARSLTKVRRVGPIPPHRSFSLSFPLTYVTALTDLSKWCSNKEIQYKDWSRQESTGLKCTSVHVIVRYAYSQCLL